MAPTEINQLDQLKNVLLRYERVAYIHLPVDKAVNYHYNEFVTMMEPDVPSVHFAISKEEVATTADILVEYRIAKAPTCICFTHGVEQARVEGPNFPLVTVMLSDLHNGKFDKMQERVENLCKEIVSRSPIMILMKGGKTDPRCGFSRQVVEIMNQAGIEFDSYDILKDDTVRQGCKKVFNWPTYPQIYCKGALIGGLDVIKSIIDEGGYDALKTELECE